MSLSQSLETPAGDFSSLGGAPCSASFAEWVLAEAGGWVSLLLSAAWSLGLLFLPAVCSQSSRVPFPHRHCSGFFLEENEYPENAAQNSGGDGLRSWSAILRRLGSLSDDGEKSLLEAVLEQPSRGLAEAVCPGAHGLDLSCPPPGVCPGSQRHGPEPCIRSGSPPGPGFLSEAAESCFLW